MSRSVDSNGPASPTLVRDSAEAGEQPKTDFVEELRTLVGSARANGVGDELLVEQLRAELAFAAEYGRLGRRVSVQITDLGFHDVDDSLAVDATGARNPQALRRSTFTT